jgi:transportin-3
MISSSFTDFQMAEKVCRLHKHCLRNCGVSAYKPLFEKLCIHLVQNFSHSRQSPYLYAASVVISEFGRDADAQCQKQLYTLLEEMGKVSFQLLHSAEQFKNHPDVVEELFFCASRMIQYCPEIFVASHIFHPFVQCATVGMTQHHKDANRGSMTFLDHVFSFGLTIQACSIGSGSDIGGIIRDCQQSIETLLSKEGQVIVTNLILSLIGELPCYRITSNNGSVAGVLYKLYRLCPNMVMDWMTVPLNRVSKTEQTLLMNAFQSNLSKDELCGVCERFVEVCSRSQRMGSAYS